MVEGVFESYSCLNGSFLKSECHYGCSSTNHGVDIEKVKRAFIQINDYEKLLTLRTWLIFNMTILLSITLRLWGIWLLLLFTIRWWYQVTCWWRGCRYPLPVSFLMWWMTNAKMQLSVSYSWAILKKNNIYLIHFLTSCDCTFFY